MPPKLSVIKGQKFATVHMDNFNFSARIADAEAGVFLNTLPSEKSTPIQNLKISFFRNQLEI